MDVGIVTVQITQARLKAKGFFFENEEPVGGHLGKSVADPKLKRHVEARDLKVARETDPAEVMNRSVTTGDENEDPLQATAAFARHFQHTARGKAKPRQAGNERQEKRIVFLIEWDVQEDILIVYRSFGIREGHSDQSRP
jgi:hypothetical protein